MDHNTIQSPLGKARGLGSTHEGVGTWMNERISAALGIPLMLWLVCSVVHAHGWDYASFHAWQARPLNTILMVLTILAMFYHAAMGLVVVIEDYIRNEAGKLIQIIAVKLAFSIAAIAVIFSILKIAFAAA